MSRHYRYASAPNQQVGLMRCCACGKKITEGLYRYHETEDAYVPCHRACCPADPKWQEIDTADENSRIRHEQYCADVLQFYDKWGALDDDDFMSIVINRKDKP
ncbi:hypothetical protein FEM54_13505 [Pseudomonas edaphica]|uniref:Uncharacterized protein n=1 Tax=Pseudomonas edaphica TaxID=2006980 RepID=A0ABY2U557_9PSED|nr:hypothetical protein FEM54_13505 [Pseudomonas edaphica]